MRKKYEKPSVTELAVMLEDGFMAGSVFEPTKENKGVSIEGHQVGSDFDYSESFVDGNGNEQNNFWD